MTQAYGQEPGGSSEGKLTTRDWLKMIAVSLVTVTVLVVSTELIARHLYREWGKPIEKCIVTNDPTTGARGIPNSFCRVRTFEDPTPIDYHFNGCGHRTSMECGPKPLGVYRIVMLGSSIAQGQHVQEGESIAALLPAQLARETGHPVELYNEGMEYSFSHSTALRFNDALAENPDLILWIFTPYDVLMAGEIVQSGDAPQAGGDASNERTRITGLIKQALLNRTLGATLAFSFSHTRDSILLRHVILRSETQYVASYLMGSPRVLGFLQVDTPPDWREHLAQFDRDAANMESRAKAAGVPMVGVFIPERGQADLISMGEWPKDVDPYKLDRQLRAIIEAHGGTYLDILPDFRSVPDPGQYYFMVDGHPTASGHKLIAEFITKALTGGAIPQLAHGAPVANGLRQVY